MVRRLSMTRLTTSRRVVRGREYSAMAKSLAPVRGDQHPLQDFELLQALPRTDGHARQRVLGNMNRHSGLMLQTLVHSLEERPTTGQDDPALHDIGRQLGRTPVEGVPHSVDDRVDRLLQGLADLL